MTLRLVGAGLGRTGTHSLKLALERLTGLPCYHMTEVFGKPDVVETWRAALHGEAPDWHAFLAGYGATVDWPACAFWRELADAFPQAPVLLSTRRSAEEWWGSVSRTVFATMQVPPDPNDADHVRQRRMSRAMLDVFEPRWHDRDAALAAYERHNARVRASVPAERLVEWRPGDGWEPLCAALDVPVPEEPFPHTNTAEEFRERAGLEPA